MSTRILLSALALLSVTATAAVCSRVYNFTDGSILTASQLNSEFNNLVSTVNSLDDNNIITGANIDPIKLKPSIGGDGLSRDSGTGILSVNTDGSTLDISGGTVIVKDSGIVTAKIADSAVTSAKIANGTIVSADIASSTITGSNIASSTIAGGNIASSTITGGNIASSTITGTNIADVSIGIQKFSTRTVSTSAPSGGVAFSTYGIATYTPSAINAFVSVGLVTNGRPVHLSMAGNVGSEVVLSGSGAASIFFYRDGSSISQQGYDNGGGATAGIPCSAFSFIDTGAGGGSHSYEVRVRSAAGSITMSSCALVAYEI